MNSYWSNGTVTLYRATAQAIPLPDNSADCVATSPPYYGLRVYKGVEPSVWGDGWRGVLGAEPATGLYIAHLVECFREIRRVMKPTASLWLNMGDVYAGSGSPGGDYRDGKGGDDYLRPYNRNDEKAGDLMNIPHRVAEALRQDGWNWRSTIVWVHPSPMPESVHGTFWQKHKVKMAPAPRARSGYMSAAYGNHPQKPGGGGVAANTNAQWLDCPGCPKCAPNDGLILKRGRGRPVRAHEYIFLMTKGIHYYYDHIAVRQPLQDLYALQDREADSPGGSHQLRNVWVIPAEPLNMAHYSTFPTELCRWPILASTPEAGVCSECGQPWARVVEHIVPAFPQAKRAEPYSHGGHNSALNVSNSDNYRPSTTTLGWRPTCDCSAPVPAKPALVLDPFCGTASTLIMAMRLGRRAVGIEPSEVYLQMAVKRLSKETLPMPLNEGIIKEAMPSPLNNENANEQSL